MLTNLITLMLPTTVGGNPQTLMNGAITFFGTWISRVGGVVAFIGAVKFALAVKADDARDMLSALLVMVSGFMIAASQSSGIFTVSAGATAEAEFRTIMQFIARWIRRAGAVGTMVGAVMFGLSIKDNNAATKISGLKTFAAGAMVIAIAGIWQTFV